jgi:hypothetical protein
VAHDYDKAAERYRPTKVRVLFIAESPPAFSLESKQAYFFFEENPGGDLLFATIVQAVLGIAYRKRNGMRKADVLRLFQAKGCWLMDAVERPINKIEGRRTSERERKNLIEKERARLLKRIHALDRENQPNEMAVVLIKNLVYECLAGPLRKAGYCVPQAQAIGFPRYRSDPATIEGIKSAIANCNRD